AKQYKDEKITLKIKTKLQEYPAYSTYVLEELKWLIANDEGLDIQLKDAKTEEERISIQKEIDELFENVLYS
ncbi:hypothetical protein RhiirA1_485194, partial [Rhizophagus irregularis]